MRILYIPNSYSQQRQHEKPANIYPVRMAMEADWYHKLGHEVLWGDGGKILSPWKDIQEKYDHLYKQGFNKIITKPEGLPFKDLPAPDREFTNAKSYTSGNYKYTPGTHMLVSSGCWYGKCKFCVEPEVAPFVRPVDDVIAELCDCKAQGFKEVFDDSGTFPIGEWLDRFCISKHNSPARALPFSANMRIGAGVDFKFMKEVGFRMLLFGIESANQYTLNRLNKGINADEIIKDVKEAALAGLEPHIAVMFGYPWENAEDELKTLKLVHYLLRKGYAHTAQASVYRVPEVGARDTGMVRRIYEAGYYPDFWINKFKHIKSFADVIYLCKGAREAFKR